MGKKSKARSEKQNFAENSGSSEVAANLNNLKKAKKRKSTVYTSHIENSDILENSNENENEGIKKVKSKKKNNQNNHELKSRVQSLKKRKDSEAKHTKDETNDTKKSKKIIFDDDEPQAVPDTSGAASDTKKKKSKKILNNDNTVEDEEINQFCDELDEKDDEVFQNWVKLIEANFSNEKKTK